MKGNFPTDKSEPGTKGEEGEAAYLFEVGLSSVKRYLSAWSIPSSTQGKYNRRVQMTKVVFLYRTDLPSTVITRPWRIRI